MQTVQSCLIGILFSVVLLGVADGSLVSQLVRALPIALVLRLASRSPGYHGAYAAVAVFAFWLVSVAMIWLEVFGANGASSRQYSPFEVGMTVLVAFFAAVGLSRGMRLGRPLVPSRKVVTLLVFAVIQLVAMAASLVAPLPGR